MRPLHAIAIAVLLISLDFRTTAVDLLPDALGWALIVWAALRLREPLLATVAGIGGIASLALFSLPYHYEQYDPLNDRLVVVTPQTDLGYNETLAYDTFSGLRLAAFAVAVGAFAVALGVLWRRLRRRAQGWDGPAVRTSLRRLDTAMAAVVGLWVLPRLVAVVVSIDGGYEPIWDDPASRVAILGVLAAVALAATLTIDAREPWARGLENPDRARV